MRSIGNYLGMPGEKQMIKSADATLQAPTHHSGLSRTVILSAHGFRVSRIIGHCADPALRTVSLEHNANVLILSLGGSMLYNSRHPAGTGLLATHSSLYAAGIRNLQCYYTRGHHEWIEIEWNSDDCRSLADWVDEATKRRNEACLAAKSLLGSRAVSPEMLNHFTSALEEDWDTCQTNVMSFAHEVVGALVAEPANGLLTNIPSEANAVLKQLMRDVRKDPATNWALKEAADRAGYSAFHLSRSFRSLIGYGFPEFVDRCRTEMAVQKLMQTDDMIEEIAEKCGFGSTQALRSACKEYTGLLPSEYRMLPTSRALPAAGA